MISSMINWKKIDFFALEGGCFSLLNCFIPFVFEINIVYKYIFFPCRTHYQVSFVIEVRSVIIIDGQQPYLFWYKYLSDFF